MHKQNLVKPKKKKKNKVLGETDGVQSELRNAACDYFTELTFADVTTAPSLAPKPVNKAQWLFVSQK